MLQNKVEWQPEEFETHSESHGSYLEFLGCVLVCGSGDGGGMNRIVFPEDILEQWGGRMTG